MKMKTMRRVVAGLAVIAGVCATGNSSAALITEVAMDPSRGTANAVEVSGLRQLAEQGIEQVSLLVLHGTGVFRGQLLGTAHLSTQSDLLAVTDTGWGAVPPGVTEVEASLGLLGPMGSRIILLFNGVVELEKNTPILTDDLVTVPAQLLDYVMVRASTSDADLSDAELAKLGGSGLDRSASTRTLAYSASSPNYVRLLNQGMVAQDWVLRSDAPTPGKADLQHTPEPTTLTLLAVAGLALLRRRTNENRSSRRR